jgi:hypothetical protein
MRLQGCWIAVTAAQIVSKETALRIGEAWKPKDSHLPNDLKGPDAGG